MNAPLANRFKAWRDVILCPLNSVPKIKGDVIQKVTQKAKDAL
jgi:hypothetical protein